MPSSSSVGLRSGPFRFALRALSLAGGLLSAMPITLVTGTITGAVFAMPGRALAETVCSRKGSEFDFDGTASRPVGSGNYAFADTTTGMRAKLSNTDYFGPAGTVAPEPVSFLTLSTLSWSNGSGSLEPCDIYIGGGFEEGGTAPGAPNTAGGAPATSATLAQAEANALLAWSNSSADHFVIGGCDQGNNRTCQVFGRALTQFSSGAGISLTQGLAYNPLTCGGAGTVQTFGGQATRIATAANDAILATHDGGGTGFTGSAAATVEQTAQSAPFVSPVRSRFLMTSDADMFGSSGNATIGNGPTADNNQAIFVLNAFKYAFDTIKDRNGNPSCFTDYDSEADLALSIVPSATTVESGDTVTLAVTVTHENGDTVGGVAVSVPVPNGFDFVSATGPGSYDETTGEWTVGTVTAGTTVALDIVLRATNLTGPFSSLAAGQIVASNFADRDSFTNIGFGVDDRDSDGLDDDDEATVALTLLAFDRGDAFGFLDGTTYGDAFHGIDGATHLGTQPDPERAARTTNRDASDDARDDGVTFPTEGTLNVLHVERSNIVSFETSVAGFLNLWFDWNQNGVFEADEQMIDDRSVSAGVSSETISFPVTVPQGPTFVRVRFSTVAGAGPSGQMPNGEVEDYRVFLLHDVEPGLCVNRLGNGGFELSPSNQVPANNFRLFDEDDVSFWATIPNNPNASNFTARNKIEIWKTGFQGVDSFEGNHHAELNANVPGGLYQDFSVASGTRLGWRFAHRGRGGTDSIGVFIGPPDAPVRVADFDTPNTEWRVYSGSYDVPAGQTITRFMLRAVAPDGNSSVGNFIDAVEFRGACDLGDAPDSYRTSLATGGPVHFAGSEMRLGARFGDTEDDAFTDPEAEGDDTDPSGDDEDGVTFGALEAGTTGTITVSVKGNGYLQGWIDFDGNGVFDGIEQIATDIRDDDRDGTILLPVRIPAAAVRTRTFARFRWSSDFDIGVGGLARDGEVEDYRIVIGGGGPVLSGRVILDTGVGGGVAHDAATNGAETGTGTAAAVELRETATGTLLTTATIDGAGNWTATLPVGFSGQVRVSAVTAPGFSPIAERTGGLPGLSNPDPHDGSYDFTPADGASYAGLDFGVIPDPQLTQDRTASLTPGQVALLAHRYDATTAASVTFALVDESSTPDGAFSHVLLDDANCDGVADRVTAPGARAVSAGDAVCLVVRTQSSDGVSPNARATYALVAVSAFDRTTVTGTLRNEDTINGGTPGEMRLRKLVRNVTRNGPEGVSNAGGIGDVLEYRIVMANPGSTAATNLFIFDRTPAYTALDAAVPSPVIVTPGVTCTLSVPAAGSNGPGYAGPLQWNCPGNLLPGEQGDVTFTVAISP